ncbi:MAG TPA: hypothetical protein VFZ61_02270 [Polyangiales bacterium]
MNRGMLWLVGVVLAGCFTPEERFDEFIDRKKALVSDAGSETDADAGQGNEQPLTAEQVAGSYLYAVSTPVDPTKPVVYLAEVEASPAADDQLDVRIRQQPLAIVDRKTPVGDFSEWTSMVVSPTGTYETEPMTLVVPPAANSFGIQLTTIIAFQGTFLNPATPDDPDAKVDFFCGTATGMVAGLNLSLDGSTFSASRIPDPEDTSSYPDVVINCNRDPAAPL